MPKEIKELLDGIGKGIIDGKDIRIFDINNIKVDSEFHFKEKNIKALCKDINWNLKIKTFRNFLRNDNFMLCFRFPKLTEIKYLLINDDIHNNYNYLFINMVKSKFVIWLLYLQLISLEFLIEILFQFI